MWAFLQVEVDATGRYRLLDRTCPQASLMGQLSSGGVDVDALVGAIIAGGSVADLVRALSRSDGGLAAAEAAVIAERRELVARLQSMATDPATTETDMQRAMGQSYWLFGGRYVGCSPPSASAIPPTSKASTHIRSKKLCARTTPISRGWK